MRKIKEEEVKHSPCNVHFDGDVAPSYLSEAIPSFSHFGPFSFVSFRRLASLVVPETNTAFRPIYPLDSREITPLRVITLYETSHRSEKLAPRFPFSFAYLILHLVHLSIYYIHQ